MLCPMMENVCSMGQSIAAYELNDADVIVRPETGAMKSTDFDNRHQAIIEGEKAGLAAVAMIKRKIAEKTLSQPLAR